MTRPNRKCPTCGPTTFKPSRPLAPNVNDMREALKIVPIGYLIQQLDMQNSSLVAAFVSLATTGTIPEDAETKRALIEFFSAQDDLSSRQLLAKLNS